MRPLAALLLACVLAGCSDASPEGKVGSTAIPEGQVVSTTAPLNEQAPAEEGTRSARMVREYEIEITGYSIAGAGQSTLTTGNCVAFSGHGRILTGVAKASWEPNQSTQLELIVKLRGGAVIGRVQGVDHQATLEMGDVWLDGRGAPQLVAFVQVSREPMVGAAWSVPGRLVLDLTFLAEADSTPPQMEGRWTCSTP